MMTFEEVFNFDFSDPGFKDTIDQFMDNRSASSVCWVSALDEVTAGCLGEVVLDARDRSNGFIELWPCDVTGRTVLQEGPGYREGNTNLMPVDISSPEKIVELIMAGGQFLEAGDAVVICGSRDNYPKELRTLGLKHCEAWGVSIIWTGPDSTLPGAGECQLVIPELPLAETGCTAARTGDFLFDLADRMRTIDVMEVAPRDREGWRAEYAAKHPTSLGEVQGVPDRQGMAAVRTPFGTVQMDLSEIADLNPFDLVVIDSATGAPLSKFGA